MSLIVQARNIERIYGSGNNAVQALSDINLTVQQNQLVALKGRSGSGKTTLLNIIGALDYPTNGSVIFGGVDILTLSEKERILHRKENIGFIFQSFGLVPLMTVEENVEFGLRIAGVPKQEWTKRINESIDLVQLSKRAKHRPFELSGGEQQRCAIARAIATRPKLILADEPTGELDTKTAFHVMKVFRELVASKQTTIIMTTHDPAMMEITDHVYALEDGKIVEKEESSIT
ncbi:ABC transporter ATP-binding protein [Aquibacillus salsiterrae]|uniref:ABC transporter ATP-binding protein n=1 Tax=Aquibacillus salsiterrae TaxID=2950439 RepID=A0A9X3WDS9_9BACI|nr:ABC transporter ATP-binding protein [Aquibacillus salsiterrae]MDC3418007.1 ABC transporter ATP-binding protein [Aquibacillus salsiterrae]